MGDSLYDLPSEAARTLRPIREGRKPVALIGKRSTLEPQRIHRGQDEQVLQCGPQAGALCYVLFFCLGCVLVR